MGLATDGTGSVYAVTSSDATWQGDGCPDIAVLKLDGNGTYQWHTLYGGYEAYSIALDGAGNIHIAGTGRYNWLGDGGVQPLHPYSGDGDLMVR